MPRIKLRHGIINPKRNNMQDKVREHNREKKAGIGCCEERSGSFTKRIR